MITLTMAFVSPEHLEKRILRDKLNSAIFEKGRGLEIFLVGGYVRDILRGITSPDRDFIVFGDLHPFVDKVRDIVGGAVVQFKKGNMIRIVSMEGLTFDISSPAGTLCEDLSQRDFTINALAWSPGRGIIDYHHGLEDLKKNRVRAISEENIASDPLRMIRAYRFAAELNADIEHSTRNIIKALQDRINKVSSERITSEIFDLLNSEDSSKYLKMALNDGILMKIFPFSFKKLESNLTEIHKLEKVTLRTLSGGIKVFLNKLFAQNLTRKGLLCLVLLLQGGSGLIQNLKFSSRIVNHIQLAHKGMRIFGNRRKIPGNILFDIFKESKGAAKDILIVKNRCDLIAEHERFEKIRKSGFLSSAEILNISNVAQGPAIGRIIEELRKAHFEEKIKTKKEAIDLVKSYRLLTS